MRLAEILQMDLSALVSATYGERRVVLGLLALESAGGQPIGLDEFARRARTTPQMAIELLARLRNRGAIVGSFGGETVRGYIHQRMFHDLADRAGGAA